MKKIKLLYLAVLAIFGINIWAFGQDGGCTPPYSPTIVTSGYPACAGAPFTIVAIANGATSYSWFGPGGFTSNLQSPTVVNPIPGTYTYSVYVSNGICTDPIPGTWIVTVNPAAISSVSSATVCAGT
ncbi:MAG TPA: hypothetical protein VN922_22290, partial [Bacteroidia bacterium]|nr:hypothetical protein [Bacteroidia bacterium]